ncbi:MAG: hypothetical protein H7301_02930 [Cryobacterium sp.]|nr:hypothetical protein [Oligoflexia bacterium]
MRKCWGGLLGLLAMVSLCLAYAQMAHAADDPAPLAGAAADSSDDGVDDDATPAPDTAPAAADMALTDCQNELAKAFEKLITDDQSKILEKQLQITTYKLAAATLLAKNKTVEDYVSQEEATIKQLNDRDSQGGKRKSTQQQLLDLYVKYGEDADDNTIRARFKESLQKLPNGAYMRLSTRFKNEDLSAFARASMLAQPDHPYYNQNDVSILWFQSQISRGVTARMGRGSAPANFQEISTQVAVLTGFTGEAPKSVTELKSQIADAQKWIDDELEKVMNTYKDDVKASCKKEDLCESCGTKVANRDTAFTKAMDNVISKMKQEGVGQGKGEKIDKVIAQMKGQGITLDLKPVSSAKRKSKAIAARVRRPEKEVRRDLAETHVIPRGAAAKQSPPTPRVTSSKNSASNAAVAPARPPVKSFVTQPDTSTVNIPVIPNLPASAADTTVVRVKNTATQDTLKSATAPTVPKKVKVKTEDQSGKVKIKIKSKDGMGSPTADVTTASRGPLRVEEAKANPSVVPTIINPTIGPLVKSVQDYQKSQIEAATKRIAAVSESVEEAVEAQPTAKAVQGSMLTRFLPISTVDGESQDLKAPIADATYENMGEGEKNQIKLGKLRAGNCDMTLYLVKQNGSHLNRAIIQNIKTKKKMVAKKINPKEIGAGYQAPEVIAKDVGEREDVFKFCRTENAS